MKRSKPMKRTSLARKPQKGKSDEEMRRRDAWWHAVVKGKGCAVCGSTMRVEGHHVIAKQTIKKSHPEMVWDPRCGMPLCSSHHSQHELAVARVPNSKLTEDHRTFARELGVEHLLERYYP